jgi:taurine dioxygenase
MEIERQAGALGAYIRGIDLGHGVDDAIFAQLRAALLEYHVICLRDQTLTPDQHMAFAKRWGPVFVHPYVPSVEGQPGMMEVTDPHPITTTWHQDTTHSKTPPRMSLLLARRVPECGGDTMFANQHVAFERLSPGLQRALENLRAVHYGTEMAKTEKGLSQAEVTAVHPVARKHPDTGRRALFVNGDYTRHFEGWTAEESRPLLEFLFAQASRAEYTWRHKWRVGDLLLWDNASVQHAVVGDVGKGARSLHRLTIDGDVPY